ncbi:hypothetical protein [Corynebacterium lowii]|uniref:Uncharacterized protein n=1 Tax=Corynebacterium lowii TaxID=1544413 RepID=A0A0Q1DTS0_9CORY|nr:hypothetical protein [Corynebacterium lowii]KQB83471.1 hypothetical protein Clow_02275 [Corynebacterium lowii]MDP9852517.1 hypothetical protein [Corynebacterium lowii]
MLFSILKGLALATGLLSLGAQPFGSSDIAAPETVASSEAAPAASAADREAAAEKAVSAIEEKAGHDLVNLDFDGDAVVVRPVESFDEEADQDAMSEIFDALAAVGYQNISAVGKPLSFELPEVDPSTLVNSEENESVEAIALPEIDPEFSHVIKA